MTDLQNDEEVAAKEAENKALCRKRARIIALETKAKRFADHVCWLDKDCGCY